MQVKGTEWKFGLIKKKEKKRREEKKGEKKWKRKGVWLNRESI